MQRKAEIERQTSETNIHIEICLDGKGENNIFTEIGFFDHMLTQVSKHSLIDIFLNAKGDTDVDNHHTIEDVGIVLGAAVKEALGDKSHINRYGNAIIPMEDALVLCALDICGRPFLNYDISFSSERIGEVETEMFEEFFRAFCINSGITLHIKMFAGKNNHHIAEAMFKSFARALKDAITLDPRVEDVPSTKGVL